MIRAGESFSLQLIKSDIPSPLVQLQGNLTILLVHAVRILQRAFCGHIKVKKPTVDQKVFRSERLTSYRPVLCGQVIGASQTRIPALPRAEPTFIMTQPRPKPQLFNYIEIPLDADTQSPSPDCLA